MLHPDGAQMHHAEQIEDPGVCQKEYRGDVRTERMSLTVKILGGGSPKFEQLVACFNP